MCPTVMAVGGLGVALTVTGADVLFVVVRASGRESSVAFQRCDELGLGGLQFCGEVGDCCCELGDRGSIGRGCGCEVGNSVDGALLKLWLLLMDSVDRAVLVGCGVDVFLTPFHVSFRHERLEVGPRLGWGGFAAPVAKVTGEHSGFEDEVIRGG